MGLIYTILIIICSFFSFYTGYKIGLEQRLPVIPKKIIHPIETIKNNKEKKEEDEELKKLQDGLKALDEYDGGI